MTNPERTGTSVNLAVFSLIAVRVGVVTGLGAIVFRL